MRPAVAGVALALVVVLAGCGAHGGEAAPATTTTATTLPPLPTRPPLTESEHEACANWAKLKRDAQAHLVKDADIFLRLQTEVANRAWVDAEGGPVHKAALAGVAAIRESTLHPETAKPGAFTDAITQLDAACSS